MVDGYSGIAVACSAMTSATISIASGISLVGYRHIIGPGKLWIGDVDESAVYVHRCRDLCMIWWSFIDGDVAHIRFRISEEILKGRPVVKEVLRLKVVQPSVSRLGLDAVSMFREIE